LINLHLPYQEAGQVKVMHRHVQKEPTAPQQKLKAGRVDVPAQGGESLQFAQLAGLDLGFGLGIAGVIPPHEPELNRDIALLN
jgi:hypothetical protein